MARPGVADRGRGDHAAPLLERDDELELLQRALDQLAAGQGSLVVVEGPAGIGKTRLLYEAADLAQRRGLLWRSARGGELERELPFGIARQLLEALVERSSEDERARLLSGSARFALIALGRADPERPAGLGDPFAPIHGLYWLLANITESRPLVIATDDAQWADAHTLRFFDYLVRRLGDLPVLVLAAARTGEPDEPEELERLRLHAQLLRPSTLSPGAVRELIASELGAGASTEFAEACAGATAGNPFLVSELVRALRADSIPLEGDAAAVSEVAPETVARYVLVRLGRFGEDAIALARAIAVLGGSPQLRHAARLTELKEEKCRVLCDRLREGEILTPGLPIDFVHPLVRQAIYRELPEGERSRLHRTAAQVLSDTGASPRDVAPHLMECVPNGDQWVVGLLGAAAFDAIGNGAPENASSYLERALAEPPVDDKPLLHALGRCMLQSDPLRGCELLARLGVDAPDPGLRRRALRHAAQGYMVAGDWAAAADCQLGLIDLLPEDDRERRLVAEAEFFIATFGGHGVDEDVARRIEAVASELAGRTPGECLARQALGAARFCRCAPVDQVVELTTSYPPDEWRMRTSVGLVVCRALMRCGHWEEARRSLLPFVARARELGQMLNVGYYSVLLAETDRLAGRLVEAEAGFRMALELASAAGSELNPGREATVSLIATLVERGDIEDATRFAQGVDLAWTARERALLPNPIEVRGHLRLARGELDSGAADLLEYGERAEASGYLTPAFTWRQEVAPVLAALGRSGEAAELVGVAEERARNFGAAHVMGTVLRARGLIEPRSEGIETLRESVRALEVYGPPHELARSLVELGMALRRDGRRSEAREPLRRAMDLAYRCGAGGLERRAREELAATGARPRRAMLTGRDALTATEQRIARMAAEGMSNPEIAQTLFLSRKTVENHLGRVYGKLGIHSREQLPQALSN